MSIVKYHYQFKSSVFLDITYCSHRSHRDVDSIVSRSVYIVSISCRHHLLLTSFTTFTSRCQQYTGNLDLHCFIHVQNRSYKLLKKSEQLDANDEQTDAVKAKILFGVAVHGYNGCYVKDKL